MSEKTAENTKPTRPRRLRLPYRWVRWHDAFCHCGPDLCVGFWLERTGQTRTRPEGVPGSWHCVLYVGGFGLHDVRFAATVPFDATRLAPRRRLVRAVELAAIHAGYVLDRGTSTGKGGKR